MGGEVDRIDLEHISEFKYLGCVLDESGTDEAEYSRKVASGKRFEGPIRSLVNARSLHLQCAKVLHESLVVPALMNGRGLRLRLNRIRKMDKVSNARMKDVFEKTAEGVLR